MEVHKDFGRTCHWTRTLGYSYCAWASQASRLLGLEDGGNEVAPIALPGKAIKERKSRITTGPLPTYGTVRIGRMDASDVGYGAYMPRPSASGSASAGPLQIVDQSTGLRRRNGNNMRPRKQVRHGFNNEVRNIDLGNAEVAAHDRPGYTSFWRWLKEVYAYLVALWSVLKGLVMFLLDRGTRPCAHIGEHAERHDRTTCHP